MRRFIFKIIFILFIVNIALAGLYSANDKSDKVKKDKTDKLEEKTAKALAKAEKKELLKQNKDISDNIRSIKEAKANNELKNTNLNLQNQIAAETAKLESIVTEINQVIFDIKQSGEKNSGALNNFKLNMVTRIGVSSNN